MTQILNKAVPINLGAATVNLLFNWNALAMLEEQTGLGITEILGYEVTKSGAPIKKDTPEGDRVRIPGMISKSPARMIRALIWAGIQHEMPGLSLNDVGEMMNFENIGDISESIAAAFSKQTAKATSEDAGGDSANPPSATPISG